MPESVEYLVQLSRCSASFLQKIFCTDELKLKTKLGKGRVEVCFLASCDLMCVQAEKHDAPGEARRDAQSLGSEARNDLELCASRTLGFRRFRASGFESHGVTGVTSPVLKTLKASANVFGVCRRGAVQ